MKKFLTSLIILIMAINILPAYASMSDGVSVEYIPPTYSLGIGISPTSKLHVNGTTASKGFTLNGNSFSITPSISQGSLLFAKLTGTVRTLAKGTDHYALKVNGNKLAWESVPSGAGATNIDGLSDAKSNAYNVYLGNNAGANDSGTSYSTAVGINALMSNISASGLYNSALGYQALKNNTNGDYNTATGAYALFSNTSANGNTASGTYSLYSNTTGYDNTASGAYSLYSNTTGYDNTASGAYSLYSNITGNGNTASGAYSLYSNTVGKYNTACGTSSLYYPVTGRNNTAVGYQAGQGTSGSSFHNGTFLGVQAGVDLTTGSNNVLIGCNAGSGMTSGKNNIIIGYNIAVGATASNRINIGNTIYGDTSTGNVGIGTSTMPHKLQVAGTAGLSTGTAWTNTSDIRLKNIDGDYEYGLAEILKLHSVRFHYKTGNAREMPSDIPLIGFIAQEVQPIFPEAVSEGKDGYFDFNIHPISVAMVNAVQELKQEKDLEVSELKLEHERLEQQHDQLIAYLCAKDPAAGFCQ